MIIGEQRVLFAEARLDVGGYWGGGGRVRGELQWTVHGIGKLEESQRSESTLQLKVCSLMLTADGILCSSHLGVFYLLFQHLQYL